MLYGYLIKRLLVVCTLLVGVISVAQQTHVSSYGALPNANQMYYHKQELAAFIHFGMNTFSDVEWGNGSESPSSFNPTDLDADQWVKTAKDAGFKRIIIVAKHHDGFCLWPSAETTHDVASSPWQSGNGDVLAEVSTACTKYDIDMGIYLSPWDAHESSYGDASAGDYNTFYANQLNEVLGGQYGNDGKIVEVWMDGAKGTDDPQTYDFSNWFSIINTLQPEAEIFSPFGTGIRWVGNEHGFLGDPCWSTINGEEMSDYFILTGRDHPSLNSGQENGSDWCIPEGDVSIRPGWFYHSSQDGAVKTVESLYEIYSKSVGRGGVLLLNFAPDTTGQIPQSDVTRINEFATAVRNTYSTNFCDLEGVTVASAEARTGYEASFTLDKDYDTYWTTSDGITSGTITVDFPTEQTIDIVEIQEYIPLGQRIKLISVEVYSGTEWVLFGEGTTVGHKRLVQSSPIRATKVRINILDSLSNPVINSIGVYKSDEALQQGTVMPSSMVAIDDATFTTTGGWGKSTAEGIQDTHMWTNAPHTGTASFSFTGTKLYQYVVVDPGNGKFSISIDGAAAEIVDIYGSVRQMGQLAYVSPDLTDGLHNVVITALNEANPAATNVYIDIDTAYALDNGGKGLFEIEQENYSVNEGDGSVNVKVKRIGGSTGTATVNFSCSPGTAVHGMNYQDYAVDLQFADGESEKFINVVLIDNELNVADTSFNVDLNSATGAELGFNNSATINIADNDQLVFPTRVLSLTSSQTVTLPAGVVIDGDSTLGFWVNFDALPVAETTFVEAGNYKVMLEPTGHIKLQTWADDMNRCQTTNTSEDGNKMAWTGLVANKWYHLTFVHRGNGNGLGIVINGSGPTFFAHALTNYGANWGSPTFKNLAMKLDNVRVWSTNLDETQINSAIDADTRNMELVDKTNLLGTYLFETATSGTIADSSGNSSDGTIDSAIDKVLVDIPLELTKYNSGFPLHSTYLKNYGLNAIYEIGVADNGNLGDYWEFDSPDGLGVGVNVANDTVPNRMYFKTNDHYATQVSSAVIAVYDEITFESVTNKKGSVELQLLAVDTDASGNITSEIVISSQSEEIVSDGVNPFLIYTVLDTDLFIGKKLAVRIRGGATAWYESKQFNLSIENPFTPALGIEFTQTGSEVTWSVEEEIGVKEYQLIDTATGDILEVIVADSKGFYSTIVPEGTTIKLLILDNSGYSQIVLPIDGNIVKVVYDLCKGWNLITMPGNNADTTALKDVTVGDIWAWNGTTYETIVDPIACQGVWVFATNVVQTIVTAEKSDTEIELIPGWNMVGPVENCKVPESAHAVYAWNETYKKILDDEILVQGIGYWIFKSN